MGFPKTHGGRIEKGWRNFFKKSAFGFHLEYIRKNLVTAYRKQLLKTRTYHLSLNRHLFDESQNRTIELCFYHLQRKVRTNKFKEDANIRAVLDYFMGLTQRKNKRLVSLDSLVSLEARTL